MKKRTTNNSLTTQTLLDFDLEESSSDSDFRIEDHDDGGDDDDDDDDDDESYGSAGKSDNAANDEDDGDDDDDDDDDNNNEENDEDNNKNNGERDNYSGSENGVGKNYGDFKMNLNSTPKKLRRKSSTASKTIVTTGTNINVAQLLEKTKSKIATEKLLATSICSTCLGDRSDDANEIVDCDNCGITVHEGCYGISDSTSVSSTNSASKTEPWFCEACKANVIDPVCELCPNRGGIFKETDVGKWVHLVCALYVPGVAFGEVDQLSSVTLFEMPYSKWGAKTCSLCEDIRFSRSGVCIGCDAGMCKTYFHVTCAQAAGLLSEAHSEEVDHADPFYAHCKIHSDKTLMKHRKRNFNAIKLKVEQRSNENLSRKTDKLTEEQQRIERKLKKHRQKYQANKINKNEPWVPTQKMPRLLSTSASACKRLILKAELMGIHTTAIEFQETQMATLADVRKKWHIPPAFSVEFIGYYLDRISRLKEIKNSLEEQITLNKKLVDDQQKLRQTYDEKIKLHANKLDKNSKLVTKIEELHKTIQTLCPNKIVKTIENIIKPTTIVEPIPIAIIPPIRPMSVPTAAALKMGVGFPLTNLSGTNEDRVLSTQCKNNSELLNECGICKCCNDQHLLAKCDTCHLYYHLGCLSPPLTRHPKKSKLYGWQCSECDKSDDSDAATKITVGPRKSRTKYSKDGTIVPVDPPSSLDVSLDDGKDLNFIPSEKSTATPNKMVLTVPSSTSAKKKDKKKSQSENIEEIIIPDIIDNYVTDTVTDKPTVNKGTKKKKPNPKTKTMSSLDTSTKSNKNSVTVTTTATTITTTTTVVNDKNKSSNDPLNVTDSNVDGIIGKQKTNTNNKLIKTNNKMKKNTSPKPLVNDNDGSTIKASASVSPNISAVTTTAPTSIMSNRKTLKSPSSLTRSSTTKAGINNSSETGSDLGNLPTFGECTSEIISCDINPPVINDLNNDYDDIHKQNRKRRKEKRRSRHGSDSDRSHSKEHKKKRKKKSHDTENPNSSDGIPKIKIKFKAMPLPGETAEPQFFYVSADMVRPVENRRARAASAEPVRDALTPSVSQVPEILPPTRPLISVKKLETLLAPNQSTKMVPTPFPAGLIRSRRLSTLNPRLIGKKDLQPIVCTPLNISSSSSANNSINDSLNGQKCYVCQVLGTHQDLVKCDECQKTYHFRCLDPPLKKTPKRRGYSWHCAECDPTDVEST